MNKEIKLSELISDHFYSTFKTFKKHNVDFAPRSSTKSSKNAIKIALKMLENPTMEVVVIRQHSSDHRKSTFRELITAFTRLGIRLIQGEHMPKGTTGILWIKPPGCGMIHFANLHDVESLKGLVPSDPNNFIGIAYFFEVTQFKGQQYDINQAISSLSRGIKPFYHNIYEWNPAANKSDWTYDFLDKMRKRPDALVQEGTYLEVPKAKRDIWFPELEKEIDMLKLIDYEQYAHIYLGKLYKAEGSIYKKFNPNRHVDMLTADKPGIRYIIGVDYGTSDATSFQFGIINKGFRGMRVVKEYYHKNGKTSGEKEVTDYANDLLHFIAKCYNMVNVPITVIIDEAAGDFISIAKQLVNTRLPGKAIVKRTVKNKQNEIIYRISVMNLMLGSDFLKIDDSCVNLIKAIDLAEYDKKGKRLDNTNTHYNDALDAFEYIWIHLITQIRKLVLQGIKYEE